MCAGAGGAHVAPGAAWVCARVPAHGDRAAEGRAWPFQCRWLREGSPRLHAPTPASLTASSTHTALHPSSDTPRLLLRGQRHVSPAWKPRALQGDQQAAPSCRWPAGRFSGARGGEGVKTGLETHHFRHRLFSPPRPAPLPPSSRGRCSQGQRLCFRGSMAHGEKLGACERAGRRADLDDLHVLLPAVLWGKRRFNPYTTRAACSAVGPALGCSWPLLPVAQEL